MRARAIVWSLVLIALASMSCHSRGRHIKAEATGSERPEHREAIALWHKHELVILEVLQKGTFEQSRLTEAIEFFEKATGIRSDTATYVGRWPTPGLGVAFKHWQEWYRSNAENLVMGKSGSGVIVVKPER
jgi:hypothetical protein